MHLGSVALVAAALASAVASAIVTPQPTSPHPSPLSSRLERCAPPCVGGGFSPYVEAKFTPEERAAKQKEWMPGGAK